MSSLLSFWNKSSGILLPLSPHFDRFSDQTDTQLKTLAKSSQSSRITLLKDFVHRRRQRHKIHTNLKNSQQRHTKTTRQQLFSSRILSKKACFKQKTTSKAKTVLRDGDHNKFACQISPSAAALFSLPSYSFFDNKNSALTLAASSADIQKLLRELPSLPSSCISVHAKQRSFFSTSIASPAVVAAAEVVPSVVHPSHPFIPEKASQKAERCSAALLIDNVPVASNFGSTTIPVIPNANAAAAAALKEACGHSPYSDAEDDQDVNVVDIEGGTDPHSEAKRDDKMQQESKEASGPNKELAFFGGGGSSSLMAKSTTTTVSSSSAEGTSGVAEASAFSGSHYSLSSAAPSTSSTHTLFNVIADCLAERVSISRGEEAPTTTVVSAAPDAELATQQQLNIVSPSLPQSTEHQQGVLRLERSKSTSRLRKLAAVESDEHPSDNQQQKQNEEHLLKHFECFERKQQPNNLFHQQLVHLQTTAVQQQQLAESGLSPQIPHPPTSLSELLLLGRVPTGLDPTMIAQHMLAAQLHQHALHLQQMQHQRQTPLVPVKAEPELLSLPNCSKVSFSDPVTSPASSSSLTTLERNQQRAAIQCWASSMLEQRAKSDTCQPQKEAPTTTLSNITPTTCGGREVAFGGMVGGRESSGSSCHLTTPLEIDVTTSQTSGMAASIQAREGLARMLEQREHSTESTASTSSTTTTPQALPLHHHPGMGGGSSTSTDTSAIPRKQDIQADIRMNKGRFQLVRKRGRSEVWNLFGQVVDTSTNTRLPYVACYACKVLYTDTGGGTGNMTRHRCSMGTSYNSFRSSSDTATTGTHDSIDQSSYLQHTQSSSFDSALAGPISSSAAATATSPEEFIQSALATAERELPQQVSAGSSSGYTGSVDSSASLSVATTHFLQQQLQLGALNRLLMSNTAASGSAFHHHHQQQQIVALHQAQQQLVHLHQHQQHQPPPLQQQHSLSGSSASHQPTTLPFAAPSSLQSSATAAAVSQTLQQQSLLHLPHPHPHSHQTRQLQPPAHSSLLTLASSSNRGGGGETSRPSDTPSSACLPTTSGIQAQKQQQTLTTGSHLLYAAAAQGNGGGQGHNFTQTDRHLFAQAVVLFCANDLHKYDIVEGEGFKNLIETALFIGRRSFGAGGNEGTMSRQFEPARNLIPNASQLKHFVSTQGEHLHQTTIRDLGVFVSAGVSMCCQRLTLDGERYWAVSLQYMSDDWRITRRVLRLENLLSEVVNDCDLKTAKILLTPDCDIEDDEVEWRRLTDAKGSLKNITILCNAKRSLNTILRQSLNEFAETALIHSIIGLCLRIVDTLAAPTGPFARLHLVSAKLRQDLRSVVRSDVSRINTDQLDYTTCVYLALKFVKEYSEQIASLFDHENLNDLAAEVRSINWQAALELELFLEPFHETVQMFNDPKQPHFQRLLPEWYALMHECQTGGVGGSSIALSHESSSDVDDETTLAGTTPAAAATADVVHETKQLPLIVEGWSAVRHASNQRLREWAASNLRMEHRVATVLNPRLRHLPLICSTQERREVYAKLREIAGISKKSVSEQITSGFKTIKNEPFKKRRRFLDQLEDCAMEEEEDELDAYLRSTFSLQQTKDILDFWCGTGETAFPSLARLARFLLAVPAACSPLVSGRPDCGPLEPHDIATLLNLRPGFQASSI